MSPIWQACGNRSSRTEGIWQLHKCGTLRGILRVARQRCSGKQLHGEERQQAANSLLLLLWSPGHQQLTLIQGHKHKYLPSAEGTGHWSTPPRMHFLGGGGGNSHFCLENAGTFTCLIYMHIRYYLGGKHMFPCWQTTCCRAHSKHL